jgi:hypothetical protein
MDLNRLSPVVPSTEREDKASKRRRWPGVLSVVLVGLVILIAIAAALATNLLPTGYRVGAEGRMVAAAVIFVGSYLALSIGRIPGFSIERADSALRGRRDFRHFFCIPGERRYLLGAGPPRAGVDTQYGAQAAAIPAGGGDGVECGSTRKSTGRCY